MKPNLFLGWIAIFALLQIVTSPVMAEEANTPGAIQGLETIDIVSFFPMVFAVLLGVVSFIGYRRDRRTKFLLVTLAFAIFALKGAIFIGWDLFTMSQMTYEVYVIVGSLLDFLVLVCIFLSITMK